MSDTNIDFNQSTDTNWSEKQNSNLPSDKYRLTYNANAPDGEIVEGMPESGIKSSGTELFLSTARPKRVGYEFKGWAANLGKNASKYQPSEKYGFVKGDITFYAIWGYPERDVIIPNKTYQGEVIVGVIVNGTTYIPPYPPYQNRPPNGAVVKTDDGLFMMIDGKGKSVTEKKAHIPGMPWFNNVPIYIDTDRHSHLIGHLHLPNGSIAETNSGDYVKANDTISVKVADYSFTTKNTVIAEVQKRLNNLGYINKYGDKLVCDGVNNDDTKFAMVTFLDAAIAEKKLDESNRSNNSIVLGTLFWDDAPKWNQEIINNEMPSDKTLWDKLYLSSDENKTLKQNLVIIKDPSSSYAQIMEAKQSSRNIRQESINRRDEYISTNPKLLDDGFVKRTIRTELLDNGYVREKNINSVYTELFDNKLNVQTSIVYERLFTDESLSNAFVHLVSIFGEVKDRRDIAQTQIEGTYGQGGGQRGQPNKWTSFSKEFTINVSKFEKATNLEWITDTMTDETTMLGVTAKFTIIDIYEKKYIATVVNRLYETLLLDEKGAIRSIPYEDLVESALSDILVTK